MNATTTITGSSRINTVEEYSGTSSLLDQTQRMTQSSISGTCPSGGCTSSVESVQQQVIRQENRAFNGRVEGLTELNINKLETLTECGLDFGLGL